MSAAGVIAITGATGVAVRLLSGADIRRLSEEQKAAAAAAAAAEVAAAGAAACSGGCRLRRLKPVRALSLRPQPSHFGTGINHACITMRTKPH